MGTRRAPGAKGPFDRKGFLKRASLDTTPSVVADMALTAGLALATWIALDPSVALGDVPQTPDPATVTWPALGSTASLGDVSMTTAGVSWTWSADAATPAIDVSVTPIPAQSSWSAFDPSVSTGDLSVTSDLASATWTANDPSVGGQSLGGAVGWAFQRAPVKIVRGGRYQGSPHNAYPEEPAFSGWKVLAPTFALGAVSRTNDIAVMGLWFANSSTVVQGPDPAESEDAFLLFMLSSFD